MHSVHSPGMYALGSFAPRKPEFSFTWFRNGDAMTPTSVGY